MGRRWAGRVWKIRWSKPKPVRRPLIPEGYSPTRAAALKQLETQQAQFPQDVWTVEALFGLYVRNYEKRHCRHWPFSGEYGQVISKDLASLIWRVGVEEAFRAVDAVFSLQWVKGEHITILNNIDRYARFILPELDARLQQRKIGEQTEWLEQGNEIKRKKKRRSRRVTAAEVFAPETHLEVL